MNMVDRRIVWALGLVLCLGAVALAEDPPQKTEEATPDQKEESTAEEPTLTWTAHEEEARAEGDEESPILRAARRAKPAAGERVRVYTNADLAEMEANLTPMERLQGVYQAERHIGKPAPETVEAEAGDGEDTPTRAPSVDPDIARQRVEEFRDRISVLEQRLNAARNPLLSRRATPPDAEGSDESDEDAAESNIERVRELEDELESARQALRQAEADLARIEADDAP